MLANGANGGSVFFGDNGPYAGGGGAGSGGAVRLVATSLIGNGSISVGGGVTSDSSFWGGPYVLNGAGSGRVRIDVLQSSFSGSVGGVFTQGFQPIILSAGQASQLTVASVGGVPVSASPTGVLTTPDAVLSSQQDNPIPVVVNCANLPLNTLITVSVKPANGASVSATGYNNAGTQASSTATIPIIIPRGGGLIYASAANSN
jgi:hypothetical protein